MKFDGLLKALEYVRNRVHRELPLQQLHLFLIVARQQGITMPELMAVLDMPQGTVSRNVKALSHYLKWQNGIAVPHGRGLLRTLPSADNRHVLAVYLTGRGEALLEELARCLEGSDEEAGLPSSGFCRWSTVMAGNREHARPLSHRAW